MKEINLPKTQTFSVTIDTHNIDLTNSEDLGDGRKLVHLGEIVNTDISGKVEKARKNGGEILYATTSIEQQLEDILLEYFMGPNLTVSDKRVMFEREILQSTALSFSSKKSLVFKIISNHDLLKGKKKDKIQKYLKQIMEWRNAFAHGKIQHDNTQGCFIKHYSGSPKILKINNDFLEEVEKIFEEAVDILKEVQDKTKEIKA